MDEVIQTTSTSSSANPHLHQLAIEAALHSNWGEAIELNEQIIEMEPTSTASLNRLARALFEIGKYSQARKIYQDVLLLDPYNIIAQKSLKKLSAFKTDKEMTGTINHNNTLAILPSMFLEEPGITKIVSLIKIAEPQKLSALSSGIMVNLIPKSRGITVTGMDETYLGILPDDTAFHLLKLIKGGNKYSAFVKSIKSNGVTLLIREVFRSRKFRNQPSFLDNAKVLTYSSDHLTTSQEEVDEIVEEVEEFEGFST